MALILFRTLEHKGAVSAIVLSSFWSAVLLWLPSVSFCPAEIKHLGLHTIYSTHFFINFYINLLWLIFSSYLNELTLSHAQEFMNFGSLLPAPRPTLTSRTWRSASWETRCEDGDGGHKYASAVAKRETFYWWFKSYQYPRVMPPALLTATFSKRIRSPYETNQAGERVGIRGAGVPCIHKRGACPKNRHTGSIYQDTSCWVRLQAIVLHFRNENCGAWFCSSQQTTWLQPRRQRQRRCSNYRVKKKVL